MSALPMPTLAPAQCQALDALQARLDSLLAVRHQLFPRRDAKNTAAMEATLREYALLITAARPSADIHWPSMPAFIDQPIIICGLMKSGTTLLTQLLDSHPALLVLPGDSHMITNLQRHGQASEQEWRVRTVSRAINPTGQAPFWLFGKDHGSYVNLAGAHAHHGKLGQKHAAGKFLAGVYAQYVLAGERRAAISTWVEKTPDNELHVERMRQYFSRARFIHIIRDPRANLATLKRLYATRGWSYNGWAVAASVARSHRLALRNAARLGKRNYLLVRYEDLQGDLTAVMKAVAAFAGVDFCPSLLQPTMSGAPATANSMYADRCVAGRVLKESTPRWHNDLTAAEIAAVSGLSARHSNALGYTIPASMLSCMATRLRYRFSRWVA